MKLLRQFSHSSLLVTLLTLTIPLSSAFPEFAAQYDSEHDIEGREQLGSDKEATTTAGPPTVPTPPPNYPPHKPGRWGPFNPRNPTSGWQPLVINETINYYEYHKHGDQNGKYVRSMCPALNTLANRGFINRTGKKLDYISLVRKAKEVFNFGEDNVSLSLSPIVHHIGTGS